MLYTDTSSGLQLSTRVQTAVMDNIDQFLALLQDSNTGDNLVSHDVQASVCICDMQDVITILMQPI